jgi:hypothetical protein
VRPGPGAWPLLGHVVASQRRPLALLGSLPAHGDLVEIRLGPRPAYVVCHPDLARPVLTDLRGFDRTGLVYDRIRTAPTMHGRQHPDKGRHSRNAEIRLGRGVAGRANEGLAEMDGRYLRCVTIWLIDLSMMRSSG